MTTDEAYDSIIAHQPPVIYLTGKTCTGKTTFSDRLQSSLGYQVIELDKIVHDAVVIPFNLQKIEGDVFVSVYKTAGNPKWNELFVTKTRDHIQKLLSQGVKVIVDGAIANVGVVRSIFEGMSNMTFVYFHPGKSSPAYTRNLTSRFIETTAQHRNGLPNAFWQHIDQDAFTQFCKDRVVTPQLQQSISAYAEHSHQESIARMAAFQQEFPSFQVVEI